MSDGVILYLDEGMSQTTTYNFDDSITIKADVDLRIGKMNLFIIDYSVAIVDEDDINNNNDDDGDDDQDDDDQDDDDQDDQDKNNDETLHFVEPSVAVNTLFQICLPNIHLGIFSSRLNALCHAKDADGKKFREGNVIFRMQGNVLHVFNTKRLFRFSQVEYNWLLAKISSIRRSNPPDGIPAITAAAATAAAGTITPRERRQLMHLQRLQHHQKRRILEQQQQRLQQQIDRDMKLVREMNAERQQQRLQRQRELGRHRHLRQRQTPYEPPRKF